MSEAMTWRPIETAPKDGREVLLFWPFNAFGTPTVDTGAWLKIPSYTEHWCRNRRPMFGGDPSHWMPLPEPPDAARSTEEGE